MMRQLQIETLANEREETLICTECQRQWIRPLIRGRKPLLCPSCVEAKAEARELSGPAPPMSDPQHPAHVKKRERAEERARLAREEQEQIRTRVLNQLPNVHALWNRAFTVALRENTDHAWQTSERLMHNYVNAKRALTK